MFNYFKNITKRYPENKENAYSGKKNPRASRALRHALDHSLLRLLCSHDFTSAMSAKKVPRFWTSVPPFGKAGYGPVNLYANLSLLKFVHAFSQYGGELACVTMQVPRSHIGRKNLS